MVAVTLLRLILKQRKTDMCGVSKPMLVIVQYGRQDDRVVPAHTLVLPCLGSKAASDLLCDFGKII